MAKYRVTQEDLRQEWVALGKELNRLAVEFIGMPFKKKGKKDQSFLERIGKLEMTVNYLKNGTISGPVALAKVKANLDSMDAERVLEFIEGVESCREGFNDIKARSQEAREVQVYKPEPRSFFDHLAEVAIKGIVGYEKVKIEAKQAVDKVKSHLPEKQEL